MTFASEESIDGARGQDDRGDAGSVKADDREVAVSSGYMEETEALGNVLHASSVDETDLTGFVRVKVLITVNMRFLVCRRHLSTIIKVGANAIKVVVAYFLDGESGRGRLGSKEGR